MLTNILTLLASISMLISSSASPNILVAFAFESANRKVIHAIVIVSHRQSIKTCIKCKFPIKYIFKSIQIHKYSIDIYRICVCTVRLARMPHIELVAAPSSSHRFDHLPLAAGWTKGGGGITVDGTNGKHEECQQYKWKLSQSRVSKTNWVFLPLPVSLSPFLSSFPSIYFDIMYNLL